MFKNMNTERASYFTERSYTTSEAENKKDIFEYWKKILGEDTLRVAEKCYGIDLVKVLNSENYVCENNHVMSEMEKVKIELFEKPINYNYSGFKGEKLAFDNFFIPLINYGIDILKNGTSLFLTDSIIDTYANTLLERLGKISLGILMFEMYLCKKTGKLNGRNSEEEYDYYNNNFLSKKCMCTDGYAGYRGNDDGCVHCGCGCGGEGEYRTGNRVNAVATFRSSTL